MRPLSSLVPSERLCLCQHATACRTFAWQRVQARHVARQRPALHQQPSRSAVWQQWHKQAKYTRSAPHQTAVKALERTEGSWKDQDDTAYLAEQQVAIQPRWRQFFTTRYDAEILAVLLPALLAIFLDPVMILIDTGKQSLIKLSYESKQMLHRP